MRRRKFGLAKVLVGLTGFCAVAILVFLGVRLISGSDAFRVLGIVYYDENLTEEERAKLATVFTDGIELIDDINIKVRNELALPELGVNERLVGIYVPVADFYSDLFNIDVENTVELMNGCSTAECDWRLVDVRELDFSQKLLAVNGKYYLRDFKSGAVFRIMSFESEQYETEVAPLVAELFVEDYPSAVSVMTLAQTGVTAFSRLMNAKMDEVGDGAYFAANLAEYLSSFDYTHTSNEASFSSTASRGSGTGVAICSDPRFLDTLMAIGLDIVELTGNHNADCGYELAAETVDIYRNNEILIVGGGKNAEEAAIPLELKDKGSAVTMLAYNLSTGGATLGDYPGANQYYEDVVAAQIGEAKARGDLVIVDMQYYECGEYDSVVEDATCDAADSSDGDQIGLFRHLIDLGADVVVGTSAHQPQTYELYGEGAIYYGLGNLFFDQYLWPGTTRSLILVHHIYNGQILQTEVRPTVYDENFQTALMDDETAEWYLKRLKSVRP